MGGDSPNRSSSPSDDPLSPVGEGEGEGENSLQETDQKEMCSGFSGFCVDVTGPQEGRVRSTLTASSLI